MSPWIPLLQMTLRNLLTKEEITFSYKHVEPGPCYFQYDGLMNDGEFIEYRKMESTRVIGISGMDEIQKFLWDRSSRFILCMISGTVIESYLGMVHLADRAESGYDPSPIGSAITICKESPLEMADLIEHNLP